MKSIISIFILKNNLFNSMLILERDCDNTIKVVSERTINKYLY
jgi:hypothetical protein